MEEKIIITEILSKKIEKEKNGIVTDGYTIANQYDNGDIILYPEDYIDDLTMITDNFIDLKKINKEAIINIVNEKMRNMLSESVETKNGKQYISVYNFFYVFKEIIDELFINYKED